MEERERELQKRLLATFRVEADEHLKKLSSALIELEKTGDPDRRTEIIEDAFREAHSLKGAARAVNLPDVEAAAVSIEGVFDAFKHEKLYQSGPLFDLLHRAVDGLGGYLLSLDAEGGVSDNTSIKCMIQGLEGVSGGVLPDTRAASMRAAGKPAPAETVRIPAAKLTSLFLQAEQLMSSRLAVEHHIMELKAINSAITAWEKKCSRFQAASRRPEDDPGGTPSKGLPEFLAQNHKYLESLESGISAIVKSAEQNYHLLGSLVDNILEDVKKVSMLPCSSLLEIFPKMARDLSRDHGKEVELVIEGGEIEIDKRILDEMKDPLMHLIRNSIDHGIEKPRERERKGKPPRGRITLAVSQKDAGKVEVVVSDDGAGIPVDKVVASARKQGIITGEEAERISAEEALPLVFRSGVTTSPIITDISGRGLGLAIVQGTVEKLNGTVSIEARPDEGTTARVMLPVVLATFRGVLVRLGGELFILPTAKIAQVARIGRDEIKTVENRETINLDGRVIALVRLKDVLELKQKDGGQGLPDKAHAVVVGPEGKQVAFVVDEFISEQAVLVKGLGSQLPRVRNIAGAAVLGTGRVVPIINTDDLIKSSAKITARQAVTGPESEAAETGPKSVLVVEDSITSRTLLKTVLETSGYEVATAVDGIDAFSQLKTGRFDIVVSDVDMPRMDGFDLTAKIRGDARLAEVPVVLVTALDSREDRERGIDAGANAYIVKSSFDQGNLLGIIRKLA